METAGLISLNAVGKQDGIVSDLTDDISNSILNPSYIQSTYYTKFYSVYEENKTSATNWPFGELVTFELNPKNMGDLLGNMYIKMSLPALTNGIWSDHLGRAIFEQIDFVVNSQTLETLDDYMMVARDELFTAEKQIRTLNYMINGELDYTAGETNLPATLDKNDTAKNLYIPLPFFFSRFFSKTYNDTPFFPLCSIYNQTIYVKILFRPQLWFTNENTTLSLPKVSLVTEEYRLTPIERNYYMRRKFSMVIPVHLKKEKYEVSDVNSVKNASGITKRFVSIFKHKIDTVKPLVSVYWFFRNSTFELLEGKDLFLNRYNFSKAVSNNVVGSIVLDELSNQIVKNIEIKSDIYDVSFIKGEAETVTTAGSIYFRSVNSQINGLYTPNKNIYSFSFDIDPLTSKPNGSENNSDSNYTIYNSFFESEDIQSNTYIFHMYYKVYSLLTFEDGQIVIN